MALPSLIGLLARKGAGKDTAAAVLTAREYQNVKFAGAMKNMLRALLSYQGMSGAEIERMVEGDLKEVPTDYLNGQTPRYAMQTLGTEWGRNLMGLNVWVGPTIKAVEGVNAVITDVRFPNEMDAVVKAGGVIIGITADWIEKTEGEHESEALIDDLIASLPSNQRMINFRAKPGLEDEEIQQFQMRFLAKINAL